jgi:hypothetical protein
MWPANQAHYQLIKELKFNTYVYFCIKYARRRK